jgi:hypothetical protein
MSGQRGERERGERERERENEHNRIVYDNLLYSQSKRPHPTSRELGFSQYLVSELGGRQMVLMILFSMSASSPSLRRAMSLGYVQPSSANSGCWREAGEYVEGD